MSEGGNKADLFEQKVEVHYENQDHKYFFFGVCRFSTGTLDDKRPCASPRKTYR